MPLTTFSASQAAFARFLSPALARSDEYAAMLVTMDDVFLVADRLLAASGAHAEFGRLAGLGEELAAFVADPVRGAEDLLPELEPWLKFILFLVDRETYEARRGRREAFALFHVCILLDVLTDAESQLEPDTADLVADPVRRRILGARFCRNEITHSAALPDPEAAVRMASCTATAFMAPIFKHLARLKVVLAGLALRQPPERELAADYATAAQERARHLAYFAGRETWLGRLEHALARAAVRGGYVLLTGPEGYGKSALVAALSVRLAIPSLGPHAPALEGRMPWLPGPLLHLGAHDQAPAAIVAAIVSQADALLLEPIGARAGPEAASASPTVDLWEARSEMAARGDAALESGGVGTDDGPRVATTVGAGGGLGARDPRPAADEVQDPARTLYRVLAQLVKEHGRATVLIDALDAIAATAELSFLPDLIPPGAAVLVTGRPGSALESWLATHRETDVLRLTPFARPEIPSVTGIPDGDDIGRAFNDEVAHVSGGWPLLVADVRQMVLARGGRVGATNVREMAARLFERQLDAWTSGATPRTALMEDALPLLAAFEPVGALSALAIQDFLHGRGHRATRAEVRATLRPLANQLEGYGEDRMKLALPAFGAYVRDVHCGPRDFRAVLENVVVWLAEDGEGRDSRLLFLAYWTSLTAQAGLAAIAGGLLDRMVARRDAKGLLALGLAALDYGPAMSLAERCLRMAGELGEAEGFRELMRPLTQCGDTAAHMPRIVALLRQAAELGDAESISDLGMFLAVANGEEHDPVEGERLLRRAVAMSHPEARAVLAALQVEGTLPAADPDEPRRLLAEAGGEDAGEVLWAFSVYRFEGGLLPIDPRKGAALLRRAAEYGHADALYDLACMIRRGEVSPREPDEAGEIIRRLARINHIHARYLLGKLAYQRGERTAGLDHLEHAAEGGHPAAMMALAEAWLEDVPERGEWWLGRAADAGEPDAMVLLADRYRAAGDAAGALALFHQAAKASYVGARGYALALARGEGCPADADAAIAALDQAAELGAAAEKREVAGHLFQGVGAIPPSPELAERWYLRADAEGDNEALAELGTRLVEAAEPYGDLRAGEAHLRRGAENGLAACMTALGHHLIHGARLLPAPAEGRAFLERAADAGQDSAVRCLVAHLLGWAGEALTPDHAWRDMWLWGDLADPHFAAGAAAFEFVLRPPVDMAAGERRLRRATEAEISRGGPFRAGVDLAHALLDGVGLTQDRAEGEALLRRMAETGDPAARHALIARLLSGRHVVRDEEAALAYIRADLVVSDLRPALAASLVRTSAWREAFDVLALGVCADGQVDDYCLGVVLRNVPRRAGYAEAQAAYEASGAPGALPNFARVLDRLVHATELREWYKADFAASSLTDAEAQHLPNLYVSLGLDDTAEYDLVLGWLSRQRRTPDRDGLDFLARFDRAREGGWAVPDWLFRPAEARRGGR